MGRVGFFALIFLFVSLVSFASAGCADNQIILRLSGEGNAHAALWNQSAYGERICFDTLFKTSYSEEFPYECTDSNNIVFYLSSETNAHISTSPSDGYPIKVCYKGLKNCGLGSKGCDLNKDSCVEVAYLSGETNAHISKYPQLVGYSVFSCESISAEYKKAPRPLPPSGCRDYDEYSCGDYSQEVADGTGCNAPAGSHCTCVWNGATDKCGVSYVLADPNAPECEYNCIKEASEATACSEGLQILSLSARIEPVSSETSTCPITSAALIGCKSTQANVPCGGLDANLPFFGFWQMIASVIGIAFVYAFLRRKQVVF